MAAMPQILVAPSEGLHAFDERGRVTVRTSRVDR
jgi:hypothetical protein